MSIFSSPYTVSESIEIDASKKDVFALIRDFNTWNIWSPWFFHQKDAQRAVSGDGKSEGDILSWDGELLGAGELEHQQIKAPNELHQEIRFVKPFKSTSKVRFLLSQSKGKTQVTWEMEGSFPFFLFFIKKQMVAMIAQDYKRGLKMLKSLAETGKVETDTILKDVVETPEVHYVAIEKKQTIAEMESKMMGVFEKIWETMQEKKVECIGNPFCFYHDMNFVKQTVHYTVCFPIAKNDGFTEGEIFSGTRKATKAFESQHQGSYEYIGNTWTAAMNYVMKKLKWNKKLAPWEEYENDPTITPENKLLTNIFVPVK